MGKALAETELTTRATRGGTSSARKQGAAGVPIVNVNVGDNANLQMINFQTNLNVQSHTEDVLFEQRKSAYMANPKAFMN